MVDSVPLTPEERLIPVLVRTPANVPGSEAAQNSQFLLEPFGIATDTVNTLGTRVRYQGSQGDAYMELGYRYALVDGRSNHDISEGFLQLRGRYGDLTGGRQHLYLGPANNTNIGTLLGLETSDAIVYQLPLKGKFRQQVGYVFDTQALSPNGYHAVFARGNTRFWRGNVGYSLLYRPEKSSNVGWSVDASQPVVKNVLDIYGEGGVGPFGNTVVSAGFYVPAFYRAIKLDTFVEYARRGGSQERFSLRLRKELLRRLLVIGFVDKIAGDSDLHAGIGAMYSISFK